MLPESVNKIKFTQLRTLILRYLPQLTSFGFKESTPYAGSEEIFAEDKLGGFVPSFSQNVLLPGLENLKLSSINIECMWLDQLPAISSCCQTLTSLTMEECSEELREEGKMIKMVFAKLIKLQLKGLPNLTQFGSGNSVEFRSMTQLSIEDCPKLKTFSHALASADIKQSNEIEQMNCQYDIHPLFGETVTLIYSEVQLINRNSSFYIHIYLIPHLDIPTNKEEQVNSEKSIHANIQSLFDEKVRIPDLKFLVIQQMDMKKIWLHDQLSSDSFSKIDHFGLYDCHNLLNIFPSNMLGRLQKLERLDIGSCISLEEIFEELKISPCMMEEIVANEAIEAVPRFVFSQLKRLELWNLPGLRSFYQGLYILELPKLKTLKMWGCNKVEILTSELLSHGGSQLENSIRKPLFNVDKVAFPQVEQLTLEWILIVKEILHGKFSEFSCNLKVLELRNVSKKSAICPCCFLYTLPNLERLDVFSGFGEEIFICEGLDCKGALSTPRLHNLQITDKEGIWYGDLNTTIQKMFKEMDGFRDLENFKVSDFPHLKEVWHNQLLVGYFSNLKSLVVDDICSSLKYMFTPSLALGLVQLQELEIKNCAVLEAIIAIEEEWTDNTLFPNLTSLELEDLPKLLRFCNFSGNSIELPSLALLLIDNCPNMETFISSSTDADMPASKENLHTDIQPFFDVKVQIPYLKSLQIKKMNMRKIWCHYQLTLDSFSKIVSFGVYDCHNLLNIFPSNMLGRLQKLEAVVIQRCNSMEQIFEEVKISSCMMEDIVAKEDLEAVPRFVFPQLKWLKLVDLPSLRSFYSGVYISEWPKLKILRMWGCNKVEILTSEFLSLQKSQGESLLENSIQEQLFIVNKVAFPEVEHLTLEWDLIVKEILHGKFSEYSCNLKVLEFSSASKQSGVCPCCFLYTLPNLEKLYVCSGFEADEEGSWEGDLNTTIQKIFKERAGFRGIENFTVSDFPHLTEVWHNQLLVGYFSNLKSLVVDDKSSSLKYMFTPSLALGLVQLQELEIKNCAILEGIIVIEDETIRNDLFPNLNRLDLKDLPKLACFCNLVENAIELPSLATLSIDKCPNMETFITNFTGVDMSTSKDNLHNDIQPLFNEKIRLPNLKHVWNMDSQGLLSFPNLLSMKVTGCDTLKRIFPASVGRNLLRLEELWIENCCMVEEIFAKEEEVNEVVPRFPRLTLMILSDLSRLQSFYPMVHISEWPMLKRFYILGCDKIEISASKNLRFQVSDGESQHEMLLLDKVPLTNLERLGLDWKWIEKEALHEKLPEYLCKLKFLTFNGFRKGADICVFCLLKKLPNLEKLQVTRGVFKEVFLSEGLGCEEEHVETPSKLSVLRLVFMLHTLQTTEAEGYGFWEGDLNTTIEHLFIENGQSSKEN
ncbi:hypothetical protein QYF36_002045 [Acer negundo]|nr:hypothetical protein QYF36_002045 [Acer negundo]